MVFAPRYCCCGKISFFYLPSNTEKESRLILTLLIRLHRCFFSLCCNVISDVVAIPLVNVGMYALMTEQFVSPPFISCSQKTAKGCAIDG
jgi:hypothetical protein